MEMKEQWRWKKQERRASSPTHSSSPPSIHPKKLNSIFGKSKKNKGYWKDIAFAITLYNDVARSVSNLVVVLAKRHRVNRHGVTDSSTLKNQNNNNTDSFSSVSITTTPISSFFFF